MGSSLYFCMPYTELTTVQYAIYWHCISFDLRGQKATRMEKMFSAVAFTIGVLPFSVGIEQVLPFRMFIVSKQFIIMSIQYVKQIVLAFLNHGHHKVSLNFLASPA